MHLLPCPYVGFKTDNELQKLAEKRERIRNAVMMDMEKNELDLMLCPFFPVPALFHNGSRELSYEGAYNSFINY